MILASRNKYSSASRGPARLSTLCGRFTRLTAVNVLSGAFVQVCIVLLPLMLSACTHNTDPDISLQPLKNYALSFNPCPEDDCDAFFGLPEMPDEVMTVLTDRIIDNDFIIYNSLIMLKLYRAQMEGAHQSYDIRNGYRGRNHPVLRAFKKYSGKRIYGDFVSSAIIYDWLKDSGQLAEHPLLKPEVIRIETVLKNIEDRVYWK